MVLLENRALKINPSRRSCHSNLTAIDGPMGYDMFGIEPSGVVIV